MRTPDNHVGTDYIEFVLRGLLSLITLLFPERFACPDVALSICTIERCYTAAAHPELPCATTKALPPSSRSPGNRHSDSRSGSLRHQTGI